MYVFCIRTQSYVTESDQQRTESTTSVETSKTHILDIKRTLVLKKKEKSTIKGGLRSLNPLLFPLHIINLSRTKKKLLLWESEFILLARLVKGK